MTWPPESEKPVIQYVSGDSVSLTIAESDNDFYHLSGNLARDTKEFHPLLPSLSISDTLATVLAQQVTVFPNSGLCIGMVTHHAVADGQTATMFMKSWASICRSGDTGVLLECLPIYDRFLIKDTAGLEKIYLNELVKLKPNVSDTESKNRSLVIMDHRAPSDTVPKTCDIMGEDGVAVAMKVLSEAIRELESGGVMRGMEDELSLAHPTEQECSVLSIATSTTHIPVEDQWFLAPNISRSLRSPQNTSTAFTTGREDSLRRKEHITTERTRHN
ncbi:hypothetical protein HHK36_003859 [Tetracentron sinense]|uniref:Uncharacterized protein n=1 Tax=Tetracentron sinense TaxID=13715 RepID=A0A834ZRV0_TETSI|nr:hypothetical protein HHK36_003859 [Tetracentron sinense]